MKEKLIKKFEILYDKLYRYFNKEINLNLSISEALGKSDNQYNIDIIELAHEIKTPLITAIYNLNKIKEKNSELEIIKLSLDHIKNLLDNSINLSNNYDIIRLCKDAIIIAGGKNRIIVKDNLLQRFLIKPEITTKVMQIFIILFSNSLKYSLEKSKIIVEITEIGKEVNCNIISKGYIIERKEWGKIFIKGRRLPNALDKPGSGLGLSIAYRLSKKIKADLRVKKSDNNETIFSFILIK